MLLKHINPRVLAERSFQGALHAAINLLGWLIPDTETVVKATSVEDGDLQPELPVELRDPFAVLDRERPTVAPGSDSVHEENVGSLNR